MLASTLGLTANDLEATLYDVEPLSFFNSAVSDRPDCKQHASLPLTYAIRNDFVGSLAVAVKAIHEAGGQIPLMSVRRSLPPLNTPLPDEKHTLDIIGRTLEIAPGAAMVDPITDPIIVAAEEDGGIGLYAFVQEGFGVSANKEAYIFDKESATLAKVDVSGSFVSLLPILAKAGWYPTATAADYPPNMLKLQNITGLVSGVTGYGEELSLLYTRQQIVASAIREMYNWVWNGIAFVQMQ